MDVLRCAEAVESFIVMGDRSLPMEFASSRTGNGPHRYHVIGGEVKLNDVKKAEAEADLRKAAVLNKDFGSDEASVWIESAGARYRLPRLHEGYDEPFAAGWARGIREVVTERSLLNCHGTFYEIPRDNSGGVPFIPDSEVEIRITAELPLKH